MTSICKNESCEEEPFYKKMQNLVGTEASATRPAEYTATMILTCHVVNPEAPSRITIMNTYGETLFDASLPARGIRKLASLAFEADLSHRQAQHDMLDIGVFENAAASILSQAKLIIGLDLERSFKSLRWSRRRIRYVDLSRWPDSFSRLQDAFGPEYPESWDSSSPKYPGTFKASTMAATFYLKHTTSILKHAGFESMEELLNAGPPFTRHFLKCESEERAARRAYKISLRGKVLEEYLLTPRKPTKRRPQSSVSKEPPSLAQASASSQPPNGPCVEATAECGGCMKAADMSTHARRDSAKAQSREDSSDADHNSIPDIADKNVPSTASVTAPQEQATGTCHKPTREISGANRDPSPTQSSTLSGSSSAGAVLKPLSGRTQEESDISVFRPGEKTNPPTQKASASLKSVNKAKDTARGSTSKPCLEASNAVVNRKPRSRKKKKKRT